MNPRRPHRWKELTQIEAKHDSLTGVQRGVRDDRAATPKTMHGIVWRNAVEHLTQNSPLDSLQSCLGRFDQPRPAPAPRSPGADIMTKFRARLLARPPAHVGQPIKLPRRNVEPRGELTGCCEF